MGVWPVSVKPKISSVGVVIGYALDDSRQGKKNSSLLHNVWTGSGAHPASYPLGFWDKRQGQGSDLSPPSSSELQNFQTVSTVIQSDIYVYIIWKLKAS
jgi:hypothetical protein